MLKLKNTGTPESEYEHQREFMTWLKVKYPKYANRTRLSLNGIPLGPNRGRIMSKAKANGLVVGESDLFIAVPSGPYHGIFIEMKKPGGVLSASQEVYLAEMRSDGYEAVCCHGVNEAVETFENYLRLPGFDPTIP